MMMILLLAFSFPVYKYVGSVHKCSESCCTTYTAISEDVRNTYPIAPYATGRYVHVRELTGPPHFEVCMGRGGVEAHFGLYTDVRTAAIVAQYADITGKSYHEIVQDLDLNV